MSKLHHTDDAGEPISVAEHVSEWNCQTCDDCARWNDAREDLRDSETVKFDVIDGWFEISLVDDGREGSHFSTESLDQALAQIRAWA